MRRVCQISRAPLITALFSLLFVSPGIAAQRADVVDVDRAIVGIVNRVLEAWARADAPRIAALYEPSGDFVSPTGDRAVGRRNIQAFYSAAFAAGYAGSRATAQVLHLRHISKTIAVADGAWRIEPTPTSKITGPESGVFVAVLVRRHGGWWISALREQTSAQNLRDVESP